MMFFTDTGLIAKIIKFILGFFGAIVWFEIFKDTIKDLRDSIKEYREMGDESDYDDSC